MVGNELQGGLILRLVAATVQKSGSCGASIRL